MFQMSLPNTTDERHAIALAGVPLEPLPEPSGSYEGHALTWDLYTVQDQPADQNQKSWRTDLGLAKNDSTVYLVALTMPSNAYAAHRRLYDTVFTHAMYSLEPVD